MRKVARIAAKMVRFEPTGDFAIALTLLAGAVAAVMVGPRAPHHAGKEFYSAAADLGVVLLVAIALEARLLRASGVGLNRTVRRSMLVDRWLSEDQADIMYRILRSLAISIVAVILILTEEQILMTLARGDFANADARTVFSGLTFGIVAITVAGVLLPGD